MEFNLEEVFLQALGEAYPSDKLAPGCVSSWLGARDSFYVSVARYPFPDGAKRVMASGLGKTVHEARIACVRAWLAVAPSAGSLDYAKLLLDLRAVR